jgi:hypothetical protein
MRHPDALVLIAHLYPSTAEAVDMLGVSGPRRVLDEPLPRFFSVVADADGLRLHSPRDEGSPHLVVQWGEVTSHEALSARAAARSRR